MTDTAPPDLAVALHLWEAHQMDGNQAAGAPIAMLRDIVTAVRAHTARVVAEDIAQAIESWHDRSSLTAASDASIARHHATQYDGAAERPAAAPSVPTGTRDPADRWWTHGSCGPAPGNADGPRWTSCVGCGITPDQWTPYNPPTNGDDTDG